MTIVSPLVNLGVRMPPAIFMEHVPIDARIWPSSLVRRAQESNAGERRDFLAEWWSVQHSINRALGESRNLPLKLFYNEAKAAFERAQDETRHGRGLWSAREDFVASAVLFGCSGERGVQLTRSLSEAAASHMAGPGQPAAAAIIYEYLFRVSKRLADAASAAECWLDSVREDPDENTIGFRMARREALLSISALQP